MMFPNISYNTTSNGPESSLVSSIHMSNYQNNLSFINQQIQLNNSILAGNSPSASTTLQLLQHHKSSSKKQLRDVNSFSSSSSSTSSCSSTSSSKNTNNNSSFLPYLANLRKEQPHYGLLPPIFSQNSQQSTNQTLLDSFKILNPSTLSMANDYLNNYLLNFTSSTQSPELFQTLISKPYIHIDKVNFFFSS